MNLGLIDMLDSIKSLDEEMFICLSFIGRAIATLILYLRTYHHFIDRVANSSLWISRNLYNFAIDYLGPLIGDSLVHHLKNIMITDTTAKIVEDHYTKIMDLLDQYFIDDMMLDLQLIANMTTMESVNFEMV